MSTTDRGRVFHTFIVRGTYECWKQLVCAKGQWYKKGLMVLGLFIDGSLQVKLKKPSELNFMVLIL